MNFAKFAVVAAVTVATFGNFQIAFAPAAYAQAVEVTPNPVVATSTPPVAVAVKAPDALACNCWAYVKSLNPALPNTANLKPNGTPAVGTVAIFNYEGTMHYALITALSDDGFSVKESNLHHCQYDVRVVSWSDPHLIGFYHFSV